VEGVWHAAPAVVFAKNLLFRLSGVTVFCFHLLQHADGSEMLKSFLVQAALTDSQLRL